jgi:hypothetical protein
MRHQPTRIQILRCAGGCLRKVPHRNFILALGIIDYGNFLRGDQDQFVIPEIICSGNAIMLMGCQLVFIVKVSINSFIVHH